MSTWFKISHHKHSGRPRPHEYTSYLPLFLLLLFVGVALTFSTVSAASPGPEARSVSLSGTMPGAPPKIAATIGTPSAGQHFSTSPVTVAGTCPKGTLVEIYKNDIFAGSTGCSDSGTYSLDIDLLIGQNVLLARVYDALNQAGPDSNTITIFYDALPAQSASLSPLFLSGTQLLLNTDSAFRGTFPDQPLNVPLSIIGGAPPYAVNIQWGDSNSKVVPRNDNVAFTVDHVYKKSGTYQVNFQASDASGRAAFLTVAAIVNGREVATAASGTNTKKLLVLWPLYVSAVIIVLSFWLGERREKHILKTHPPVAHI